MKKHVYLFCGMRFSYYICSVLLITQRPKILKKAETKECFTKKQKDNDTERI